MITQFRTRILTLLALVSANVSATGNANDVVRQWQQWPIVGQATLSWLWLDIYSSQLRSPDGKYKLEGDISPHPVALEIRYLRDISSTQLLEATEEQWQKQGFSDEKIASWMPTLTAIFPSVKTGEKLIYVTDGTSGEFVYISNSGEQKVVGTIDDESLNDAFLAIWLSPKTEYQTLRQQLLGMNR